jgi:hypothetical protein
VLQRFPIGDCIANQSIAVSSHQHEGAEIGFCRRSWERSSGCSLCGGLAKCDRHKDLLVHSGCFWLQEGIDALKSGALRVDENNAVRLPNRVVNGRPEKQTTDGR